MMNMSFQVSLFVCYINVMLHCETSFSKRYSILFKHFLCVQGFDNTCMQLNRSQFLIQGLAGFITILCLIIIIRLWNQAAIYLLCENTICPTWQMSYRRLKFWLIIVSNKAKYELSKMWSNFFTSLKVDNYQIFTVLRYFWFCLDWLT